MSEKIIEKSSNKYNFNIDIFEGPLDLLLHLAKTQKIEISEISIDTLISQYIEYIDLLEKKEINIASEYIEMAAELIRLKSRMLLPNIQEEYLEELEEFGFSKEELLQKLIEYKKYKEVSKIFNKMIEQKKGKYYKAKDKMDEYREENFKETLDVVQLKIALETMFLKQENIEENIRIMDIKELNVEDMMNVFKELREKTTFKEMTNDMEVTEKLSCFLALLESLKLQYVDVDVDDQINIYPKENDEK